VILWLSSARDGVLAFLSWWYGELAGMLPAWLRQSNVGAKLEHVVVVGPDGLRLTKADPNETAQMCVERYPVQSPEEIAIRVSGSARAGSRSLVGLRFPYSYCFSRFVELPASASQDFERLLQVDLERATPFRIRDVYAAFLVQPKAGGSTAVTTLRQLIVKRQMLEEPKAALEKAGVSIDRIDCWDESGAHVIPVDFSAGGAAVLNRRGGPWGLILGMLLLTATLCSTAAYIYLSRLDGAVVKLEEQTRTLRDQSATRRDSDAGARAAQSLLASLDQLSTSTISKLEVIDELTRLLPDSAWVSDLRIGNDSADITGYATSAVSLLPVLEKSHLFVDASSTAAVTFDQREDKERFAIHVRFRRSAPAARPSDEPRHD